MAIATGLRPRQTVVVQEAPQEPEPPFVAFWEDVEGGLRGQPNVVKLHTREQIIRWAEKRRGAFESTFEHTRQAFKLEMARVGIEFCAKLVASMNRPATIKRMREFEKTPMNLAAMLAKYQKDNARRTQDIKDREPIKGNKRQVDEPDMSILDEPDEPVRRRVLPQPGAQAQPQEPASETDDANDEE